MLYNIIIAVGMLIIIVVNSLLAYFDVITSFSVLYGILAPLINLAVIVLWELAIAGIIHAMPRKYFSPYNKRFKIFSWEKKLYEWSKIRTWKEWVPDTGQLCNFKKDELKGTDNDYLFMFLEEACYADAIHLWMGIGGFLLLLLSIPTPIAMLTISLPIAVVSLFLNIPPIIIQRYNRPKLLKVYERNMKRQNK